MFEEIDWDSIVQNDGGLLSITPYVEWEKGETEITLDGTFSVDDLERMLEHIRKETKST